MNLNGILSSRIIGPRESFAKYYEDLLVLTPGRVPIFTDPPGSRSRTCAAPTTSAGLALLEIRGGSTVVDSGVRLSGPVPVADVVAIHLPDDRSAREQVARRYANVHDYAHLLRVTPGLFDVEGPEIDDVLADAERQDAALRPFDWRWADRVRGAVGAAVHSISSESTLRTAAGCLPGGPMTKEWLNLRFLGGLRDPIPSTAETLLYAAALDVLATTDVRAEWDRVDVLERITVLAEVGVHSQKEQVMLASNLRHVRAIVTDKREFAPFRSTGRGLRSAMAVLMVLLRPELSALVTWDASETGADSETRQLAAILAGVLRGLSRETTRVRNSRVDDHTAGWICSLVEAEKRHRGSIDISRADGGVELSIDGQAIRSAEQ